MKFYISGLTHDFSDTGLVLNETAPDICFDPGSEGTPFLVKNFLACFQVSFPK